VIEITLKAYGPNTCAALAGFLPAFIAAEKADAAEERASWEPAAPADTEETVKRVVEEAAAEEPAPKKRGRPKKEEPAANISATPEDRQPPLAEVEDGEIVENLDENSADGMFEDEPAPAVTREELYAAAQDLVAKVGMPDAMAWLEQSAGVKRLKEVPEDEVLYARLVAEIKEKLA
jgi:hypothetical protein